VNFLSELFRGKRDTSAQVAKERLLTVLVHDRVKLTPEVLAQLKQELSEVIERYVPTVDPNAIEVSILRGDAQDKTDRLKADVPLRRMPE
jgi:cell division topological specificity factor